MKAEYINHMGDDLSVVNAARVSFHKHHEEFTDGDERLVKFLATHKHELPFAHTAISLRITAPIFIRTQCFKHKVGFVENEVSRRYVKETPTYFIPESWRETADNVKQGSGKDMEETLRIEAMYAGACSQAISTYEWMLDKGVCAEQARMVLPQSMYTEWIWTGSLLAYSRFYNLRTDSHAQKETQNLAKKVDKIIKPLFPKTWAALTKEITND